MTKLQAPPEKYAPDWLQSLDGRTAVAQTMNARWQSFTDDLGGAAHMSYAQRSLAQRALWLEYWMEQQEQVLAAGGDFDVGKWTQAANSLQGILAKLGLNRVARDIGLAQFLARRKSEAKQ